MSNIPCITEQSIITSKRLTTRVLTSGNKAGCPIIFIHGNMSAATWFEETMLRLPAAYYAIAPDLRGYGMAEEAALIDATRGLEDFSDDIAALMQTLHIPKAHFVAHSLGGGVMWRFLAAHSDKILSLTQVCPASPYGYGGCKLDGTPCYSDGAGSGASSVNPEFANRLAQKDATTESNFSPLNILNNFVWKPPFQPQRIDAILEAALAQHCSEKAYPGDTTTSPNWPFIAPGQYGPVNALSPIYQKEPLAFCDISKKPPILWVQGEDDAIISDQSPLDLGTLGQMGAIEGWPGETVYPPQPMRQQIANSLKLYESCGGNIETKFLENTGHSPYLEKPELFDSILHGFIAKNTVTA
ncbi:alpha/beta hydrolase [Polycladidibacter stylochi]|uniref:alpha/beta hydrolase n=1 Tax=Polycladidibacter stylochi TaxID=1807766 RepID=UPI000A8951BF|nr:alpha/beta hydrolase [Pseudovibrio stylochi]